MPAIDESGKRYGRLVVLHKAPFDPRSDAASWVCLCDCGEVHITLGRSLRRGQTRSCGCLHKEEHVARFTKHGHSRTPTYYSWQGMKDRCLNPRNPSYENYGGRGLVVCERWSNSFDAFLADMGERPEGLTIEREDNDKGYDPSNCKWGTLEEQLANRRPYRPRKPGKQIGVIIK